MKKIVIASHKKFESNTRNAIIDILSSYGYYVEVCDNLYEWKDITQHLEDANALVVRGDTVDKEIFDSAPKLEIVIRAGSGYENIDIEEATRRGIAVVNTPGQNAQSVAELIFGMLLFYFRNQFACKTGSELKGRKLGIYGFGAIAEAIIPIAKGFGLNVYVCAPDLSSDIALKHQICILESVESLFSMCDIVSIHIPSTKETEGMIDYSLLMNMPPCSILMNTARCSIIDEEGLWKALSDRKDLAYLTDSYWNKKDEFRVEFGDRVLATRGKIGGQTHEANLRVGRCVAKQLARFFKYNDNSMVLNSEYLENHLIEH